MKFFYLLIISFIFRSPVPAQPGNWAWINGDTVTDIYGKYGTSLLPDAPNKPGARLGAISWLDASDNLWLFGGEGLAAQSGGLMNDLWKYNPVTNQYVWMNGSNSTNNLGRYGTKGKAGADIFPGARSSSVSWTDQAGNLWLFGGLGYDAQTKGLLNDLWKYDPLSNQWTWVSGSEIVNRTGLYGQKGVAAARNIPGARRSAISWLDGSGNFWLFGGFGYAGQASGLLNDLWKYNPVSNLWTWVSGDNATDHPGIYGVKLIPATNKKPGSREGSVAAMSKKGEMLLFGGEGFAADGKPGYLNDMWKYDPVKNRWEWLTGDNLINQPGVYGTKNLPDPANKPGSKANSISWTDSLGRFWLFGGSNGAGYFNDFWQFSPLNNLWIWIGGNEMTGQSGIYGTIGVASPESRPGARGSALAWVSKSGETWLFGGKGFAKDSKPDYLNDLWKFNPLALYCPSSVRLIADSLNCSRPVFKIDPVTILPAIQQVFYSLTGATTGTGSGTASGRVFNKGLTVVNYRLASDPAEACSFDVLVEDITAPMPVLAALPDIKAECAVVVNKTPIAVDNCDGTILGTTVDPLHYNSEGKHTINWTYKDSSGNIGTQLQNIIIRDTSAPDPIIKALPDIKGNCSVSIINRPRANDACAGIITGATEEPLTYTSPGIHLINWIYKDNSGNTSTQQQKIILTDTTAPVPLLAALPDLTDECSIRVANRPRANDACSGMITGTTEDPVEYSSQGTHVITWTFIDNNGNKAIQQQKVIIKDVTAPVPDMHSLPGIAECSAEIPKPTATDNCAGIIVGTTVDPGGLISASDTITWIFRDGNGNSSSQAQKIIRVESGVNIFPNPTRGYINFRINTGCKQEPIILRLFDAPGRLLQTSVIPSNELFVLNLMHPAGTYFAQLIYGNQNKVVKLVKL